MLIYLKVYSIKQQINFLIPCHPKCSYLTLSNQLELLLTQILIDNIFSYYISLRKFKSNHFRLLTTISHCTTYSNVPNRKTNIFERDWSKFYHEELMLDYFTVDWPQTLKLQNNNIDASFQNFFDSMSNIFDKHAPFKKITEYELQFRNNPWIIPALQNSISVKNKFLKLY